MAAIHMLPDDIKTRIRHYLRYDTKQQGELARFKSEVWSRLLSPSHVSMRDFTNWLDEQHTLDLLRGQSMRKALPELYAMLYPSVSFQP
jgi:hypothetical protein